MVIIRKGQTRKFERVRSGQCHVALPGGMSHRISTSAVKVRRDDVRAIGTGVPVLVRHGGTGIIGDNDAGLRERPPGARHALHRLRAVAGIGQYI